MKELDTAILAKAAAGDTAAFGQMLSHYEGLVYNIIFRMFANREDANDLFQEVFIKVYKSMGHCQNLKHFKSWLCRITTNTCIDELRRRKGKETKSLDESLSSEGEFLDNQLHLKVVQAKPQATPEEAVVRREMWQDLQQALNRLPEEDRALVILRDMQGLSYDQLAEAFGLPLGTVKSRLSRARIKLKNTYTITQKNSTAARTL